MSVLILELGLFIRREVHTAKNLAKAMLNYGAMAQILFDRANADFGLANAELSAADQSAISKDTDTEVADNIKAAIKAANTDPNKPRTNMSAKNPTGLEYAGSSVVFLTKTSLRHYYRITKDDYAKTGEGAAFKFNVENDNYVYFERTDIPAAELDILRLDFPVQPGITQGIGRRGSRMKELDELRVHAVVPGQVTVGVLDKHHGLKVSRHCDYLHK